jgi:hypothetical protein
MTSTTDIAQHPDVTEISDLTEGLLPPARTADIRHHLDRCALCADVHNSLEEIRGLLGTLPGEVRMPSDIAGRIDAALIDAALAAESLLDATAPEPTPASTSASDEPAHVSRETTSPTVTPAPHPVPADTASAGTVRTDRPAGYPRSTTGPGRAGQQRRRRRGTVLGAVFGTAAVGVSVLLLQALPPSGDSADSARGADSTASSSASDGAQVFSGTLIQSRVDTLLTTDSKANESPKTKSGQPRDSSGGRDTPNSPLLKPVPKVPACIRQGIGSSASALAIERGTYRGSKAYLVVLPDSGNSTRVQAFVVDAACVDSPSPAVGEVLLTHFYPRR